jgi:N6-adenosine-specific RNA methylase IME4
MSVPFPEGKFGAMLWDPPWRFRTWSETNQRKSASKHYALMMLEEIKALPVSDLALPDCVLFLWVIAPMFPQAHEVIVDWGFEYKTVAFVWDKGRMGLGYWTRHETEQCWLATRGQPRRRPGATSVRQKITEKPREHSRKPDCVHDRIEALVTGPYLEGFARGPWPGWTVWGDECGKFADPQQALALGEDH